MFNEATHYGETILAKIRKLEKTMIQYLSYTNHLQFPIRCHHSKILPKDLQLKTLWWEKYLSKRGLIKHTCSWRVNLLYYNSMEFWDFLNSYVVWQLLSHLVFTIFITNNHVSFHLLRKKYLVRYPQVSKYYEHGWKFQKWHLLHTETEVFHHRFLQ